ncbi:MAG: outer membrane protein assembly factor BamB [Gammaproteobacteria bacterium]|nr:outer membrane protein assembly factor BamB [Gammaproteobacteria bacterium]
MKWFSALLLVFLAGCANEPINPPSALLKLEPKVGFKLLWSAEAGSAINKKFIRLNPYASGDRLFTAVPSGRVTAFNRMTGKLMWRVDLNVPLSAGVGGGEGALYVASQDGVVIALDPEQGAELWRVSLNNEVLSAPVPSLGRVIVRTVDGSILALKAESGGVIWRYSQPVPPLTLRGTSRPVPVAGGMVSALDNGKVIALDLEQGRPFWQTLISRPTGVSELDRLVDLDAELLVDKGSIFVAGYQGNLARLSLEQGQTVWSKSFSTSSGMAFKDDRLFINSELDEVLALNARDGSVVWQQDKLKFRRLSAPVIIANTLALADEEGYLHLLSLADGRLLARYKFDDYGLLITPLVVGETLYVQTRAGTVYALNLTKLTAH